MHGWLDIGFEFCFRFEKVSQRRRRVTLSGRGVTRDDVHPIHTARARGFRVSPDGIELIEASVVIVCVSCLSKLRTFDRYNGNGGWCS